MLDDEEHPLKSETLTLYVPATKLITVVSFIILAGEIRFPKLSVH